MEGRTRRCVVIGASGGIGSAFCDALEADGADVWRVSRGGEPALDYADPASVERAAEHIGGPLDLVIVATGLLHAEDGYGPEKSMRDLDADALARAFLVNTIGPALVARSFLPLMRRDARSVFAALSARVGSISDNGIGGWYGYRSAKAALNQMLKTASIEHARRWPQGIVVGLHPGTVDTGLSKPFQRNVAEGKLFDPDYSARSMLAVLDRLQPADTGKVFDYKGEEVPA